MNELAQELYEKAIVIVKNAGKTTGIYSSFEERSILISYSSFYHSLFLYYKIELVLSGDEDQIHRFIDGDWVHEINKKYKTIVRNLMEKVK